MSRGVIRWENPPEVVRPKPGVWHDAIAAQLRQRPGEWALIHIKHTTPRTMSEDIMSAKIKAYRPAGAFESKTVRFDNAAHVYARFVGDPQVSPTG